MSEEAVSRPTLFEHSSERPARAGNASAPRLPPYVPLLSKLVWPVVLVGVLVAYHARVDSVIGHVDDAISQGRSVEIPRVLKIGEAISVAQLHNATPSDVGKNLDLSINAVGGYSDFIGKGSAVFLDQLRDQLRQDPKRKTIDVLVVTSGRQYSVKLLGMYISELGIRFIVFNQGTNFDSWIEAPLFSAQLPRLDNGDTTVSYDQLRRETVGLRTDSIPSTTSAVETLKTMEKDGLANIAVVEGGQFKFIANRDSIVAKLFVASLPNKATATAEPNE
jgi:hypothetical protein